MQVFVKIGNAVFDISEISGIEGLVYDHSRVHLKGTTIDVPYPIEKVLQLIGTVSDQMEKRNELVRRFGQSDEPTGPEAAIVAEQNEPQP